MSYAPDLPVTKFFAAFLKRVLPARERGDELPTSAGILAAQSDFDMMARCIALSREANLAGELPFASLICRDGKIIAASNNRVVQEGDVTRHAEMLALSIAQQMAGSRRLRGCTLYSNVEPCAMCAFAIRETGISRVVYAIKLPVMGGQSRWNILADPQLSQVMPIYFARPPTIIAGLCAAEAEAVWNERHPVIWTLIKARGGFG